MRTFVIIVLVIRVKVQLIGNMVAQWVHHLTKVEHCNIGYH